MPQLPLDSAGVPMQNSCPATMANASTSSAVATSAVDFELTAGTRRIEVLALAFPMFIRYTDKTTDAATTSNFDKIVAAGERQLIALPDGVETVNMISTDSGTAYVVEYA